MEQVANHPDIEVLAVHSGLVIDDVGAFLAERGWRLDFAVDSEDEAVFRVVNGSSKLPQTIVLNRRGEGVYNQVGTVTYDKLVELLRAAEG